MTAQAPPTWLEDLATADTSWIFDATHASSAVRSASAWAASTR
jgi:hypothetical protein